MALRLPYTHPTTGAHFPEAVARLEQVFLNLADSWLVLRVAIYPDAATATQGREPLAWRTHVVPAPVFDATMRPQAKGLGYSYLASLPEYASAQTV